eukprot:23500-Eustigmatos_ZCMA.PRE.1
MAPRSARSQSKDCPDRQRHRVLLYINIRRSKRTSSEQTQDKRCLDAILVSRDTVLHPPGDTGSLRLG